MNRIVNFSKSSLLYIKSYLKTTTAHGLIYLVKEELTIFEKCIWFILIAITGYFSFEIFSLSIQRYYDKSTVLGVERDFYYWNTTMPTTTVCPLNRLNTTLFENYAQTHNITGKEKLELFEFLESLANATYKNLNNIRHFSSTDRILQKLNINSQNYIDIIFNLTMDRSYNGFSNGRSIDQITDDKNSVYGLAFNDFIKTRLIMTENGFCYTTNNLLDDKLSAGNLLYDQHSERNASMVNVIKSTFFDWEASYVMRGFEALPTVSYIHSAYDVLDVEHDLGFSITPQNFEVDVMEMSVEGGFQDGASVYQRRCRFQDESNLTHFPIYSKVLCIMECRLNLIYEHCKCIPHFYPNRIRKPKSVCDYKTLLSCVAKNHDYFLKLYRVNSDGLKEYAECYCLPNCQNLFLNRVDSFVNCYTEIQFSA